MIDYAGLYEEHGDFLRGYCYRLAGTVAEAHDLAQETFVRALERPPPDTEAPWRPWLVRVATNLWRDHLRRNRHEYVGVWLPAPLETAAETWWRAGLEGDVEGRYEARESVTFAFLLALEALTPAQRAVLLLRDVYDYSTRETAEALDLTEANVKTTLHRARRALARYDSERCPPREEVKRETAEALERLLECFAARDARQMEALLASDVEALTDAGGRFHAARKPVRKPEKVALYFLNISREEGVEALGVTWLELNGLPALVLDRPQAGDGLVRRWSFSLELDRNGRIRRTYSVLSPEKLGELGASLAGVKGR